jgi:hypothetical protein
MKQCTLKNANSCSNTKFYFYSDTSIDQTLNVYLNVVHFFNKSVN